MSPLPVADRDTRVTDPVCGMRVDPATSPHTVEHDANTFHFCSAGCRARFIAAPENYLEPGPGRTAATHARATATHAPAGVYTCPMHPEVRQAGPGSCPICCIALEPLEITAAAARTTSWPT